MNRLSISVRPSDQLSHADQAEILALCGLAYDEDAAPWLTTLVDPVHVIGRIDGRIVSHAAWVERWLKPSNLGRLRAAYIEAVATMPDAQGRGHAAQIMMALTPLLGEFDIAALSPSDPAFYARLGWELWQGELSVRTVSGVIASPHEVAMIFRLPKTPLALDLTAAMSIDGRDGESW